MTISLIAAMGKNEVIGNSKTNDMPWGRTIPEDLKFFREQTIGQVVIYGRKTFESMGNRLLPYRTNIILTHHHFHISANPPPLTYGFTVSSLSEIENYYKNHLAPNRKMFICGGANIYFEFLAYGLIDEMIITHIDSEFEGDIRFPLSLKTLDEYYNSEIIKEIPKSNENPYHLTMKKYLLK